MNNWLEVLSKYDAIIYKETLDTLGMILGPTFIAVVAGLLLGGTLTALKRGNKFSNILSLPLRLIVMVISGYPIILLVVLLAPFLQDYLGTIVGIEVAQPILIFWGTFYFGNLIYRSLTHYQIDGTRSMNVIQNFRHLILGMITASAVLGMIGMGGLGGILLQYGFFKYDYPFAIAIAAVYAVMILCVEFLIFILKSIFKPRHMIMPMTPEYVAQLLKDMAQEDDQVVSEAPQKVITKLTPKSTPQMPQDIDSLIHRK